jgi:hypothetical protein
VKHFLYAGLEYASKLGNFDPKYRTGHLDGKGKVVDYLKAQPTTPMAWSVITSCLYIEGLREILQPFPNPEEPGTMIFAAPLGCGRCPLIHLEDYGQYARWIFGMLTAMQLERFMLTHKTPHPAAPASNSTLAQKTYLGQILLPPSQRSQVKRLFTKTLLLTSISYSQYSPRQMQRSGLRPIQGKRLCLRSGRTSPDFGILGRMI